MRVPIAMLGETPILMADGRTKPLAEVRAGDEIYGTVRQGFYRRYARRRCWRTGPRSSPPTGSSLEDGTQLICQRRSPLPDRARLEVRHRDRVRPAAAPAPDRQQQADGRGRVRGAAQGDRRLPARLPVRHDPRRRDHRALPATREAATVALPFRLALADPEALARTATTSPAWASAARSSPSPKVGARGAG